MPTRNIFSNIKTADGKAHLWKSQICGVVFGTFIGIAAASFLQQEIPGRLVFGNDSLANNSNKIVSQYQSTATGMRFATRIAVILERGRRGEQVSPTDLAMRREAVDAWMLSNPIECLNFLYDSSAQFLIQEETAMAAILHAAEGSLIGAINIAENIKSGRLQQRLITTLYSNLIASDPASAFDTHGALPKYLQEPLGHQLYCQSS